MDNWPDLDTLVKMVKSGETSSLSLVEKAFSFIKKHKDYNVLISDFKNEAMAQAKEIDDRIAKGEDLGRLAGIPFIVKDNFLTHLGFTTAGSNMLKNFKAPYQATAVNKLVAEGAILIGKSNLDAFAHGASTENSDFMVTKNPYDINRVAGGSSGGSAAAVALNMAPFSLGSDTGGSIRTPASFCGNVGFKPSYGLVSRSGVIAMASSLDVVGPITRTVADASLILDIISGQDKLDGTTIKRDDSPYLLAEKLNDLKGIKIGVVSDFVNQDLDKDIRDRTLDTIAKLKINGAEIIDISIPSLDLSLPVYYIICPAEVSSNLSRYDGIKYGYNDPSADNLENYYLNSRSKGFGKEAKRRIMIGTYVLSSGYYDAYYKKAQQVRTKLINEFNEAFKQVDFLVGPTSPTLPFKIGEKSDDPVQMYLSDVMTVAANLVGIPAISLPVGFIDNLPVGFQIMAPFKSDKKLLELADFVERLK